MNSKDFERNFRQSWYGVIVTPEVVQAAVRDQITPITQGTILPAHHPRFSTDKTILVTCISRIDEDNYTFGKLLLPWKQDIDLDKSVMLSGVPTTGMIQCGDICVYVARSPIRDATCYGYWPEAHTVFNPWPDVTQVAHNSQRLLWRIFNPIRYSWHEACQLINNGDRIACPIDRYLALGALKNRRFTQIFFKTKNVGFINENNFPVMFLEHRSVFLCDYIHKLSGIHPLIK